MIKGKDLLNYALGKINPNDKFHAIGILASSVLNLDRRHKNLLGFVDPLSAYEYIKKEILSLENCDELICKYLVASDLPLPYRYGWKHIMICDSEEKIIDECEWFEDKHECYCSMWKRVISHAECAIDMSCEGELKITSKYIEWIKFERLGTTNLFTIYEIE